MLSALICVCCLSCTTRRYVRSCLPSNLNKQASTALKVHRDTKRHTAAAWPSGGAALGPRAPAASVAATASATAASTAPTPAPGCPDQDDGGGGATTRSTRPCYWALLMAVPDRRRSSPTVRSRGSRSRRSGRPSSATRCLRRRGRRSGPAPSAPLRTGKEGEGATVCLLPALSSQTHTHPPTDRPRVPACGLCGTTQDAGTRWQEWRQKHEEKLRTEGQGGSCEEEEQRLTLR